MFKSLLGSFCSFTSFSGTSESLKIIKILEGIMDHFLIIHRIRRPFWSVMRPNHHGKQRGVVPIGFSEKSTIISRALP